VSDALPRLEAALRDGADAARRNAARTTLAALAAPSVADAPAVLERLGRLAAADADADVRLLAATALGESANPAAVAPLCGALGDPESNVAAAAADALGLLGDARATEPLSRLLDGTDGWLRVAAAVALGRIGDPRAIPALERAARDPALADAAASALGEIGEPRALPSLQVAQASGAAPAAQNAAARILAEHPDEPVPTWLRPAARARQGDLLQRFRDSGDETAARLLGIAGTAAAAEALLDAFTGEGERRLALAALLRVPAEVRGPAVLRRLREAKPPALPLLLAALPPLHEARVPETVAAFLAHDDAETRASAAEALARFPRAAVLPVLRRAVDDSARRAGAAAALASLDPPEVTALLPLVSDADPRVRVMAAQGLARVPRGPGGEDALALRLHEAIGGESDTAVRDALLRALGSVGGAGSVPALRAIATDGATDPAERFAAVRALGCTGAEAAMGPLVGLLADPAPEIQAAALQALGELGEAAASLPVAARLSGTERDLRRTAAAALEKIATPEATARLIGALADPDREIRLAAVRTLGRIATPEAGAAVRRIAEEEPDPLVRAAAAEALADAGDR
jgi:HEAT repeat protein